MTEGASDFRQLVKQITVQHGDWGLLDCGTASSLKVLTFINDKYLGTSPPRGSLFVLPNP